MWYQCSNAKRGKGFLCDEKLHTGLHWFPEQVYCCWHPCWKDKDLPVGWVQARSHPNRWLLLWVHCVCFVQCVRAVMPTHTSEVSASPRFSTLPLTWFSSHCILRTCSQRDLWHSWPGQRDGEAGRVTMTIPSPPFSLQLEEVRIQAKKFW